MFTVNPNVVRPPVTEANKVYFPIPTDQRRTAFQVALSCISRLKHSFSSNAGFYWLLSAARASAKLYKFVTMENEIGHRMTRMEMPEAENSNILVWTVNSGRHLLMVRMRKNFVRILLNARFSTITLCQNAVSYDYLAKDKR